jgi:putative glutamine amidotransferase
MAYLPARIQPRPVPASTRPKVTADGVFRTERGAARSASVQYVRLTGSDVDVMLPGSGSAEKRWDEYRRRIIDSGTYEPALDPELAPQLLSREPRFNASALERLSKLSAVRSPATGDGKKPRIGIMVAEIRHLAPDTRDSLGAIIEGIRKLGAEPVLIPPRADLLFSSDPSQRTASIRAMINQLDGLVGPGGWDVVPRMYWEKATHSLPGGTTPERLEKNYKLEQALFARDRFGADVTKEALTSKKVFSYGICRSHQMMNVIHGGSLIQDMMKEGFISHSHNQEDFGQSRRDPMRIEDANGVHEHPVTLAGEYAARVGASELKTNAIHHQAVGRVGRGLELAAASTDPVTGYTIVEGTRAWNVATVQYHPEARLEHAEDWAVFSLVGRAWAFHALEALTTRDRKPSASEVLAYCRERNQLLDETDERWLLTEFKQAQKLK